MSGKTGGGAGRSHYQDRKMILLDTIERVEMNSDPGTSGPYGSTKVAPRVYEIYDRDPHRRARSLALALSTDGEFHTLEGEKISAFTGDEASWVAHFGTSAVTFRNSTESTPTLPGVTVTIGNGSKRNREVQEIHFKESPNEKH